VGANANRESAATLASGETPPCVSPASSSNRSRRFACGLPLASQHSPGWRSPPVTVPWAAVRFWRGGTGMARS